MSTVDLNRFASHIERLELANRALISDAATAAPKHHFHQPAQVMYGGAHIFSENTFEKIAGLAKEAFHFAARDARSLSALCGEGWDDKFAEDVFSRVARKLHEAPVEDYRIDFEDGYGVRSDEEEDEHAKSSARVAISAIESHYAPRCLGIRIKPLSMAGMRRSLKTLALFVQELNKARKSQHSTLKHLIVTLPKVTNAEQVATLVEILDSYEKELHLGHGFFSVELVIESPEAFIAMDGTIPLTSFLRAAAGRCRGLHFGVYDFTSSLGIGSAGQSIDHMACDFARMWLQVVAALVPNITVSDGIISRLPLVPKADTNESRRNFESAWHYNYQQMMRSLANGYYQGWDLHPCQLPVRQVANHVFVLKEFDRAVNRLKTFAEKASQASHVNGVFDDRASVLGLLNFFDRAVSSGIIDEKDLLAREVDLNIIRGTI